MRRGALDTASRGPSGGPTLLLAALLLGAQLLLAVHSVDHLDSGSGASCEVCLVGQHLDHGLAAGPAAPPLLPNEPPGPSDLIAAPAAHPTPAPRQRGPPRQPRIV